jgi:hypothetical protein
MFAIKYRDPTAPFDSSPLCHGNINFKLAEGKTVEETIDELPTLNNPAIVDMNEHDKFIQKKVLKLALATLCYLNTADPDVAKYKFHNRPKLGAFSPDATIIGQKYEKAPPGWHLREAHFRTLRDPRFHRDDEGKPRVIWVRSAEVNKGREAAGEAIKEEIL